MPEPTRERETRRPQLPVLTAGPSSVRTATPGVEASTSSGSAETQKDVLENPAHISKHVLSKGLDAGTAYEILSIDIADVDVGENIGAKLQIAWTGRRSDSSWPQAA